MHLEHCGMGRRETGISTEKGNERCEIFGDGESLCFKGRSSRDLMLRFVAGFVRSVI